MRSGKFAGTFAGDLAIIVALLPASQNAGSSEDTILPSYSATCLLSYHTHGTWEPKVRVCRLDTSWLGAGEDSAREEMILPHALHHINLENSIGADWKSFDGCSHANDNVPEDGYGGVSGCL
ncbi:MAG: hypothetical protein ACRBBN_19585 [Methyloligellaceae bacterium]